MVTFQGQEAEGKIRRRQFTVWNYGTMMAGSKEVRNCELPATPADAHQCTPLQFFCAGVDVALM
jgi:hypothetical protein